MKAIIKRANVAMALFCAAAVAGLAACDADPIGASRGELPDKEPLENTHVLIRSQFT